MDENKEFESGFSTEDVPISDGFWTYMENYWHHNREFPESTEVSLKKKADLIGGKVPASQLPSYVDDVLEFETVENLPRPGEKGKIYLITNDNSQFRWSGSEYIQLNSDVYFMTLNSDQNVTGKKYFITSGGSTDQNNKLIVASFDHSLPGMTFHKSDFGSGNINFSEDGFNFVNAQSSDYVNSNAKGFKKSNSNDDYFLTGGGGHINKHTKEDSYFHSGRNFAEGTLIKTTVDYSVDYGHQFLLEMKGNMYSGNLPLEMKVQGYIYFGKIISERGYSTYPDLKVITAMNLDGKLCFWFPRLGYWQGFSVKVTIGYGGPDNGINKVIAIEDSPDPIGTKRVEIYIDTLATQEWTNSKPSNNITAENISNWNDTFDNQHNNVTLTDDQQISGKKNFKREIDFSSGSSQIFNAGEPFWEQRSLLKRSWDGTLGGDYIELNVPGNAANSAQLRLSANNNAYLSGNYFGEGFAKNASSDNYVLTGGGGHKLISDFATLSGNQTFTGSNTFTQSPVIPSGTQDNHAINLEQFRKYNPYKTKRTYFLEFDFDGTVIEKLYLPNGSTSDVDLKFGTQYQNYNTTGLLEFKISYGASGNWIYRQAIQCVANIGYIYELIFVEEVLYYDATKNQPYINIHKKLPATNRIFIEATVRSYANHLDDNSVFIANDTTGTVLISTNEDYHWEKYDVDFRGILDNDTRNFSFLGDNGNIAKKINAGGLLVSNLYQDEGNVPTNGIWSKGIIKTVAKIVATHNGSTSGQNLGSGGIGNTLELRNYDLYGTNFWTNDNGWGFIQQQRFDGNPVAYDLRLQPLGGALLYGTNEVATVNQLPNMSNYIPTSHPVYGITSTNIYNWSGYLKNTYNMLIQPNQIGDNEMQFGFGSWNNNNNSPFADYLHFGGYSDSSGGNQNLIMFNKQGFGLRQWQGTKGSPANYVSFVDYWHTGNFNPDSKVSAGNSTYGLEWDGLQTYLRRNANLEGFLYHSGNFNPANYLTIDTPQTIVGDKTFSAITKAKFLNTVDAQKGITKTIGNGYGNLNRRTNPTEYSFWGNTTGAIVIILPSQFTYQDNFEIDIVDTQWANLHQKLQINTYGSLAYSKALLSNNTGAVDAVSRLRIGKLADNRSCLIINDVDKVWSYPQMVVNQYEGGSLLMATGDWTTQLMTDLSSITIQQEVTITKAVNSTHTHSFASLTSKPTTLAGYGITDSVSTSHAANSVSASLMNNWNTAYNWGNHATAGYAAQAWVSSNFPNQTLSANDETNLGQTVTLTNGNSVQITNNFVGSRDGSRNPDDINPAENSHRARFDFAHASSVKGSGNYAGIMTYSPWDGTSASTGDSSYQLAFANQTGINGKGVPMLKLRKGIDDKWSSDWYKMWSDGDFSQDDINKWNDLVSNAATHAWASANFLSKSGGTVEGKIKINPGTGVTGNSPIAGNANPASLLLSGDNGLWGTAFGHNSNTGDLWLQPQRFDGGSQLYNINLAPLGGTVTVNNQPVATRSWVQSQNYAPYEFVESKINELKGEIVDPSAFAIRNEFTTVIITDKYSGNPLELIEELIPGSYISIINLSKKAIELSRDGETIDRIFEFETSEYYITKDENRLIKKGTFKSAQLLI